MIILKKISRYIWEYKWMYFLVVFGLFCAVTLDMAAPLLTQKVVDDVIIGGDMSQFTILMLGFLGIGVGRSFFQYIKEYNCDRAGSAIATAIRKDLFQHIEGLSAEFFDRNNTGELMARVKDDVDHIWDALSFVGMLLLEVSYHTILILVCMVRINLKLSILPFIAMILCGSVAIIMENKLGSVYGEISEENASLNTIAEENLEGVRTVKAFAREKFEIKKFLSHNQRFYDLNMKQSKIFIKYHPIFTVITKVVPLATIMIGGGFVMKGEMTLGELTAFVQYSTNFVWPLEMLGWLTNSVSSAVASNKKLQKIYAERPAITEVENPVVLDEVKGQICFENVSFCKADEFMILKQIDFKLEPGKTLGIMGATGSGKTSIVQLLERMYDVAEGAIYVDGVDIRKLTLKQLRTSISLVNQDVFLFSDTISENIKLGDRDRISLATIERASADAQAKNFIEKLEKKYETVIGERGVGLSGGQKQRISIARALAKKTPILIMDDSTSALDMETEREIEHTLEQLEGTTKIIIAHRISAVKKADEIIVLDQGQIAERGTHETLLAKKGLYYQTYLVQTGKEA